jgi:hypothetical protein
MIVADPRLDEVDREMSTRVKFARNAAVIRSPGARP